MFVLATSKPHKMAASWVGVGVITGKISETNYIVDLPERRDKGTILHVNMIKPYHQRKEHVNFLSSQEKVQEVEADAEIPFPNVEATKFDWREMVEISELEGRVTEGQLESLV